MPNRLLTDDEIAEIMGYSIAWRRIFNPLMKKLAEAQDAKTLKAVGGWLEKDACITFDQQTDSDIFQNGLEALKRGEMPSD